MGRRKKNTQPKNAQMMAFMNRWQSAEMNGEQWIFYYEWLMNLAASRYTWENLPVEIDERFLELSLISHGLNVFFYDGDYNKYFACQGAPSGKINMYQNPTAYMAYGADGFNRRLSAEDCVPIWNNYMRTPLWLALEIYARRLESIDRTLDVNLVMQKMPAFITCDETQRLTVENLVKQWQGNEPVIIGDNLSFNGVDIGYITAGVDYIGDKLLNAKMVVWSEIMTYLGIDNTDVRKAERVQSAEVESNNQQVSISALVGLDCRRKACEEINRKYDLGVWCDKNVDYSSVNFAAITTLPARAAGAENELY